MFWWQGYYPLWPVVIPIDACFIVALLWAIVQSTREHWEQRNERCNPTMTRST